MYLQRGDLSILSALAAELPDVLTAIILPKLSMEDTLNLAQVSKWFRDVVWSVGGVRSLEAKVKAARPDSEWMSELMYYAARFGNVPAVRALLQSGEDVNKTIDAGRDGYRRAPPIHAAASCGHSMVVKVLIDAGADVNKRATIAESETKKPTSNVTAVNMAAMWDHAPVIMELVNAGADVNIADGRGRTPLHYAALEGYDACVALLVDHGADINIAENDGNTPMTLALKNDDEKDKKVVKLLKHVEARNRV